MPAYYGSRMNSAAAEEKPAIDVVIVAAGRGLRAGGEIPKQFRTIAGKSVLKWCVECFLLPEIRRIVIAANMADRDQYLEALGPIAQHVELIAGGDSRQASVLSGLRSLAADPPDFVLIHDGARAFVSADVIRRTIAAVTDKQGALPSLAVSDTLRRAGADGLAVETVARDGLFSAQTPQGFPYPPILNAHVKANEAGITSFTDDVAVAEWAGLPSRIVEGSPDNIKLTWPKDFDMAEARLRGAAFPDVRTGNGYDVHSFEPGAAVWLCGVEIPHEMKLSGHSDADVGLHALTDALLATCSAGDIGTHFPPSDPQWKGASSRIFVEHAAKIVRESGGRIANVDVTLICEAPKVGPHREVMVAAMADMLGIDAGRVSVKATTNEKLGFVGRKEGIAAIATASVIFPGHVPA